ncbi:hypothetical protein BGX29_011419 [Mortierella sp. GBA35]|nr:hypothetical protein BGX29_011419 [Mortierella sp. GBA35]
MRHPLKFNWTLGSTVLLSLALLLLSPHLATPGEARSTIDDLKSTSLYWKRNTNPQDRLSQFQQSGSGSGLRKKRSLFSHVNDDIVVPSSPPPRPHAMSHEEKDENETERVRVTVEAAHERSSREQVQNNDKKVSETEEKLNFWADNDEEDRTLIEPHYPSIDLFDEEELLEVGEDGILRAPGHHRSSSRQERNGVDDDEEDDVEGQDRGDQVWLVDEWEEELEGDMDEWMDWVEEDHVSNRVQQQKQKDKNRMRDQSAIESMVFDEDEASPFQRLFSESWLF